MDENSNNGRICGGEVLRSKINADGEMGEDGWLV